jgi:hypothetical protein
LGLWIRLKPAGGEPGAPGWSTSIAASTWLRLNPAAPKIPSIPCRAMAWTIATEPMPLAMAPET